MTLSVQRILAARQCDRDPVSSARLLLKDASSLTEYAHLATLDQSIKKSRLRWTLVFPVAGVRWERVPLYDESKAPDVGKWLNGYDSLNKDWSSMFHLLKRLTAQTVQKGLRIADVRISGEVQRDTKPHCAVQITASAVDQKGSCTESTCLAEFDPIRWPDTKTKASGPIEQQIVELVDIHKALFFYMMRYPFPKLGKEATSSSFFYYLYTIGAPDVTSFLFSDTELTSDDLDSARTFMNIFVQPLFGRRVALGQWEEFLNARHAVPQVFDVGYWRKPAKWSEEDKTIMSSFPVEIELPASGKFLGRLPPQLVRMAIENAPNPRNVLLAGTTGAGKTYIARLIHEIVNPKGEFVECNAPSLEDGEIWVELKRIVKKYPGRQITLFLDEIDKTKQGMQAQLLNFLQGLTYPSGSGVAKFPAAAIVAAGSQIEERIQRKEFLPDLENRFEYRIRLSKLSERKGDVLLLMHSFVNAFKKGKAAPIIFDEFADWFLYRYAWDRGDVRELRHVARRIANLLQGQNVVTIQFLERIASDLGQFGVFVEHELNRQVQ